MGCVTVDMCDAVDCAARRLGGLASAISAFGSEATLFDSDAAEVLSCAAESIRDELLRAGEAMTAAMKEETGDER